jgi:hypothetical protein
MKTNTRWVAQTATAASVCLFIALLASTARAQDAAQVGIVSNVKVLSDKSEDVSSPEAWKKTYIKDGMSDEDKALAIWKTIVKYRHQDGPPNEGLGGGGNVHDPLKTINVYGYGMCCCAASNIEALARYAGFPARGRIINQHSVPEVWYDGSWHLLDASLMCYFRNKDGKVASVDEIKQSIAEWKKDHPEIKNDADLKKFSKDEGWKNGPTVLATNQFYDKNGINDAGWHGWWSNVTEYNYKVQGNNKIVVPPDTNGAFNVYDYGGMLGYQVNVQLREGEKLTRCWFNKGLVVNGTNPGLIGGDRKALGFQKRLGDLAPGRIGNGVREYDVLSDSKLALDSLAYENLTAEGGKLRVADASKPATLVINMPCSYVYLNGEMNATPVVGDGGSVVASISLNNGLDWTELAKFDKSGAQKIDLKSQVFCKYAYRVKLVLSGAGTGLDALKLSNDFQHSQAPLPVITAGENKITFNAGAQEGTITYEGNMSPSEVSLGQLSYLDFHPVVNDLGKDKIIVGGTGKGDITFNLATPGDMTRLRFCSHYRCRDQTGRDYWDVEASFDGGKSFTKLTRLDQGQPANVRYVVFDQVPAGTRAAQLRFSGCQGNTTCMFDLRIDADYKEPAGGFRPVKVTYVWSEAGQEKKDEHVCRTPDDAWVINCAPGTVAKSYMVELAK